MDFAYTLDAPYQLNEMDLSDLAVLFIPSLNTPHVRTT